MNNSEPILLNSIFITGTDTDVGKTYITAGLGVSLHDWKLEYFYQNFVQG